jgi:hypothetical protein
LWSYSNRPGAAVVLPPATSFQSHIRSWRCYWLGDERYAPSTRLPIRGDNGCPPGSAASCLLLRPDAVQAKRRVFATVCETSLRWRFSAARQWWWWWWWRRRCSLLLRFEHVADCRSVVMARLRRLDAPRQLPIRHGGTAARQTLTSVAERRRGVAASSDSRSDQVCRSVARPCLVQER